MKTLLLLCLLCSAVSSEAASIKKVFARITNYSAHEKTLFTKKKTVKVVVIKKVHGKKVKALVKRSKKVKILVDTSDHWTNAGETKSGLPIAAATATSVGIAAVDRRLIPFRSLLEAETIFGPRFYLAGDIGGAVTSRTASGRSGRMVIDLYGRQTGTSDYGMLRIIDYRTLTPLERASIIDHTGHGNLLAIQSLFQGRRLSTHKQWFRFGHRLAAN